MIMRVRSHWSSLAAATVPLVVLAACSWTQDTGRSKATAPSAQQLAARQKEVAGQADKIASLKKEMQAITAQTEATKNRLPFLLAETDSALRQAQQYSVTEATQKNPQRKQELADRAAEAQQLADQKSKELVTLREGVYGNLDRIRVLNEQMVILAAEKDRAEELLKKETQPAAKRDVGSAVKANPDASLTNEKPPKPSKAKPAGHLQMTDPDNKRL